MTTGSTLIVYKQALKTALEGRPGIAGATVHYSYPSTNITGEDIWLDSAISDNRIPVMRANTKKVDEDYTLTVIIQVLKMQGEGQEAADIRCLELLVELQQLLAETPQLIPEIHWSLLAGWTHFVGPFEGKDSARGSRFEVRVNVRARLFP